MNELFLIAADYLKGKSIYPALRRTLNLLFNISIASFIYEQCYGTYDWLNYNDYKGILNFFVKGHFFLPFSIYIVVYSLTQFLSIVIFSGINHFKTIKLTREIIAYQVKKDTVDERLREITKVSKVVSPIRITKSLMLQLYQELRGQITPEVYQQMESELKAPKNNLEANFSLAFRALIALTIYFISLPQFGWLLFSIAAATLILSMYVLMIAYRFLDILPTLVRKLHSSAEEYLKNHLDNQNTNEGEQKLE